MDASPASNQAVLENLMVKIRLRDFDPENCPAVEMLQTKFGSLPNRHQLLALAQVIKEKLGIALDREATRRKNVLIKWYDENLEVIKPFIFEHIQVIEVRSDDSDE